MKWNNFGDDLNSEDLTKWSADMTLGWDTGGGHTGHTTGPGCEDSRGHVMIDYGGADNIIQQRWVL